MADLTDAMVDVVQLPLTFTVEQGIRSLWRDRTDKFNENCQKSITARRERQEKFPTVEAENGQICC